MPTVLKTPGVFVEEISTFGPSIVGVATAIPAFIGYTANHSSLEAGVLGGAAKKPVRITSFKEYELIFGKVNETINLKVEDTITSGTLVSRNISFDTGTTFKNKLYYHMQLYFSNGGGPCYIVSIGAAVETPTAADFGLGLEEIELVDEPTLIVFPEAYNLSAADHAQLIKDGVDLSAKLQDRFVIADVNKDVPTTTFDSFRGSVNSVNNKYGALYYPALNTLITRTYTNATATVTTHTEAINGAAPTNGAQNGDLLSLVQTENTAMYNAILTFLNGSGITLPASAAVAGVYAQVDDQRGVWKAPANVPLDLVSSPSVKLSDADQEGLNVNTDSGISINAIRAFTGKGNLIWGARTMDGNSAEWRYINVRRLFIFTEESVKKALQAYVFEPNTSQTWLRLKGTIDNFLTGLWRQGALAGAKPDDAFFVRVGLGVTITADDINNGILNIEIGLAASRPAEFIVLKFSQIQQVS